MFVDFFYRLREKKVPVSITEWMTLMEAISRGYARSSLTSFYYLARSILVKSETYFDQYDMAFQDYFRGIETPDELVEEVLAWLKDPFNQLRLTPEELAQLKRMEWEELLKTFAERMREQEGQHDGGDHWIGRGGTSPFGHSGENPAGIRVEGEGGKRSAVQVAQERHFQNYRSDITLDVRQLQVALKRLRQLNPRGPMDELDLEGTIDATSRNAGELDFVWMRSRKNTVKLLLLMDVGGSMTPYSRLCSRLFSAAHSATHFKDFKYYYFHNCIYDKIYEDIDRKTPLPTPYLIRTLEPDYKVILVGDASMATDELVNRNGAIWYMDRNETPGIVWLKRLSNHFTHCVWLNPEKVQLWNHPTVRMIRRAFPMYPLTLEGLDLAIKKLIVKV